MLHFQLANKAKLFVTQLFATMTDRQMQDPTTPARNLELTYLAHEVAVWDQYPVGKIASPSLADMQYVVAES